MSVTLALFAALGTATCWAISPFFAFPATKEYGALAFTRLRAIIAAAILLTTLPLYTTTQSLATLNLQTATILALTGLIGIAIGDCFLFVALRRLGPRRNAILFATNAPMAFVIAAIFLGEKSTPLAIIGCATTISGVILAIRYGGPKGSWKEETHRYEDTEGKLSLAILSGLAAAAAQAIAVVTIHTLAMNQFNPMLASTIRITTAAIAFTPIPLIPLIATPFQAQNPLSKTSIKGIAATAIIGVIGGVTLLNLALSQGVNAGIIASISATSPVIIVFIQWAITKKQPRLNAFTGATLAVAGIAMLSLSATT